MIRVKKCCKTEYCEMRIHEFLSGFQICILIVPTSYDSFATVVTQQNGDYNKFRIWPINFSSVSTSFFEVVFTYWPLKEVCGQPL